MARAVDLSYKLWPNVNRTHNLWLKSNPAPLCHRGCHYKCLRRSKKRTKVLAPVLISITIWPHKVKIVVINYCPVRLYADNGRINKEIWYIYEESLFRYSNSNKHYLARASIIITFNEPNYYYYFTKHRNCWNQKVYRLFTCSKFCLFPGVIKKKICIKNDKLKLENSPIIIISMFSNTTQTKIK